MSSKKTRRKVLKGIGTTAIGVGALSATASANVRKGYCSPGDLVDSFTLDLDSGYASRTIQVPSSQDGFRLHFFTSAPLEVYLYNPYQEDPEEGYLDFDYDSSSTHLAVRENLPGSTLRIEAVPEDSSDDGGITTQIHECRD